MANNDCVLASVLPYRINLPFSFLTHITETKFIVCDALKSNKIKAASRENSHSIVDTLGLAMALL